jgi:hypothetical protein
VRRFLLIAGLLLVAGGARAEGAADPRSGISVHVAVMPGLGAPIVPVSSQFIAHLTPRLAGAFEAGSYFYYVLPVLPYLQLGPRFYVIPRWIGTGGETAFAGPLYFGRVGAGVRF